MLGILALIAAPIAGVLGYAATRPGSFRVERSTRVAATPEQIAPHILDFRRWADWSPYEKLDPDMKKTFGGAASGRGATYNWEGKKSGVGRMEITDSSPSRVTIRLDFDKPFKANNIAEFLLQPTGDGTTVTWAMHGPQSYFFRVMGVFKSMDSMVGKDFETGLANLKAIAERAAPGAGS